MSINDIANSINYEENELVYFNNIILTKKEIEILDKYDIDYKNCSDMSYLMYLIEDELNYNNDLEDLEWALGNISDRNYYANTNK